MEHLFRAWKVFRDAVTAASHRLLLFDYDGTLTPIAPTPGKAVLSSRTREKLRTLQLKPGFSIGVVSGRSLSETRDLVRLEGIYYAGNHGLEIQGPGIDFTSPLAEPSRTTLKQLADDLDKSLKNIRGVIIQNKGLSLSVHYRLVPTEDEKEVTAVVRRITGPLVAAGNIHLFTGKKVWEVRPPIEWDKGKAVETIRDEIRKRLKSDRLLTAFFGDDLTDEDAFKVLRSPEGWGIYIGGDKPDSAASYYLDSTNEVDEFLGRMIDIS